MARRLKQCPACYLLAATFGNVHGVYKPGSVKLKPRLLQGLPGRRRRRARRVGAVLARVPRRLGIDLRDIHEALGYGVEDERRHGHAVRARRAIAGHFFKNYDGVLKVDAEVGDKKAYDPRTYLALAEQSMRRSRAGGGRPGSAGPTMASGRTMKA